MAEKRIHQVCASMTSEDFETEDFDRVQALAYQVVVYARRLGFRVMYENADTPTEGSRT